MAQFDPDWWLSLIRNKWLSLVRNIQFDSGAVSTDKYKYIAHAHILTLLILNNPTKRVHPFSHVGFTRTQKVTHCII